MSTTPIPLEVFYSYADTDEPLLHELEKHLSLLASIAYMLGYQPGMFVGYVLPKFWQLR